MLIGLLIEMQLMEVLSDALQSNALFKQITRCYSSLGGISMNRAQTGPEIPKNKGKWSVK